MKPGQWIEIFRAGTHTDASGRAATFTRNHLQEIVDGYDPARYDAPVVIGHPQTNLPRYAAVKALKVAGDLLLYLEHGSEAKFNAMRAAGRFKKRSASFFLPDSLGNPTPGKLALRHVGWLGAMPPAVKGLRDVAFADGGRGVAEYVEEWKPDAAIRVTLASIFARIRDSIIETDGIDAANRVIAHADIVALRGAGLISESPKPTAQTEPAATDAVTPEYEETFPPGSIDYESPAKPQAAHVVEESPEQMQARELQFAEAERVFHAQRAAFAVQQEQLRAQLAGQWRWQAVSFADGLVADETIPFSSKRPMVELMISLSAHPPVSFGEGEDRTTHSPAELLRSIFDSNRSLRFS